MKISACRSCDTTGLKPVLDLGEMPLADRLRTPAMLDQREPRHPLSVVFCPTCSLMQIAETVPPETLFCEDYPYYSSFSPALLEHSRKNAEELIAERGLNSRSLVIELASNDGYMLRNFQDVGIPVLGIDPAAGPAAAAQRANINTMCTFFTRELAETLRKAKKTADVIIANNVLAHVPDLNGFVAGIAILLAERGMAVIECPYVRDLIDHCEFDTIYHEHLCYYSVTALDKLFARHGLTLTNVRRLPIHGGSLRLYVQKQNGARPAVERLLAEERAAGLDEFDHYRGFAKRVSTLKSELLALLGELRGSGKRIAAYGAAAKGATMINYVGLGADMLEFVVDRNNHKHGKYMPGQKLPIYPVEKLLTDRPDYTLLLAWNFADEIVKQQAEYLAGGGKFIRPVPRPEVM
jgi:SAM-dependent methyltransferase